MAVKPIEKKGTKPNDSFFVGEGMLPAREQRENRNQVECNIRTTKQFRSSHMRELDESFEGCCDTVRASLGGGGDATR